MNMMKSNLLKSLGTLMVAIICCSYSANAQNMNETDKLSAKQQSIVTIAAFTANGNQKSLNKSLWEGLDAGLTINEIKEVIVQLYAYAGFPRSLNALSTFMTVLNDRKQNGINDELGKFPSPLPTNKTKLELGTELQTRLVGAPVRGEVFEFAPAIDQFLKVHLFWDIFGRDNLDFKSREIATIAALASLGMENQLRSHFNVGMYNGLTKGQLNELVSIIQSKVGNKEGDEANAVLQKVLNPDNANTKPADKKYEGTSEIAEAIFPKGEKITNSNFKGNAWLESLVVNDNIYHTQVGNVTFEPGARTNWHSHPGGQILLAIGGTGYYQEKGSDKRLLRKGDVVKCLPNIAHWHGASPDTEFIQIAITPPDKGQTVWLEPVSDDSYNSKIKTK
jgi:4-carboxymuconolactone decarboxylase